MGQKISWITWENHRRSIVLAKELGANYYFVKSNETFVLRHLIKTLKTVVLIYQNRNGLIVVQNPSRVLAALASLMKLLFRFPLIVDRHTNFRLGKGISVNPAIWFVVLCSEISLKIADLTIVTNDHLKKLVERKGGRSLVLHDKIPEIEPPVEKIDLPNGINILFICTYAEDEPYSEVITAARYLTSDYHIHLTGNYQKVGLDPASPEVPANVHFLGFVSAEVYESLLFSCDIVMVLTSSEWVILCGGYEAMAVQKPLITSNTQILSEFYQGNAVHTDHSPKSIADSIIKVSSNYSIYNERISYFADVEREDWRRQWHQFIERLSDIYRA